MDWTCRAQETLTEYQIDGRWDLLLDPDRVFWALTARNADGAKAEAADVHARVAPELKARLDEFRFASHVTALYVNLNDACHADCRYCYIPPDIRHNGHRMDKAEMETVLRKAIEHFSRVDLHGHKPVIIFHGGEPLVAKDVVFWAIGQYSNVFAFGLQTDGVLLTDEDVDFLREHRVSVGISLDSHDPEVHSYLRRAPGREKAFANTVRAIEHFAGYQNLNVVTTITKHNMHGLSDLVSFLHAREVPVALMNPVRASQPYARAFQPSCDDLLKGFTAAAYRALALSEQSGRPILIGDFSNLVLAIVAPEGRRLMCDITPCGGGRCFLAVTGSGEMIPCGEFQGLAGFSGGNIFRDNIEDAITSAPFQQVRKRIVERIEECRDCGIRNICGAPCPAEAFGLTGNMLQPSPYCDFYKGIVKLAFQLIAEGKTRHLLREGAMRGMEADYCLVR